MKKLANYKKHGIATLLSILVLSILMVLGPASAVTLSISASSSSVAEGQDVTFTPSVDIDTNERIPFTEFEVEILDESDSVVDSCSFTPSGSLVTCDSSDFSVSSTITTGIYGYGYGYGYGFTGSATESTNFGYGYGYGYSTGIDSELTFTVVWTTPDVGDDTTYTARLSGTATEGSTSVEYVSQSNVDVEVRDVSGSGGGGSSSSSSDDDEEETTDDDTTTSSGGSGSSEVDEIERFKQETGISDDTPIKSFAKKGDEKEVEVEGVELTEFLINSFEDEEVKRVLREESNREGVIPVTTTIRTKTQSYEVELDNGETKTYTRIERTIDLRNYEGEVTVVEVIPKELVESAATMFGDFEILYDDPVVKFTAQGGQEYTYFYTAPGEIDNTEEITVVAKNTQVIANEPEPTPTPTPEPTPEPQPEEPTPEEPVEELVEEAQGQSNWLTVLAVIVILGLIAGIAYYFVKKRK